MNPIALSKHTIAILRNFSKISKSFAFQPGNALKIRSEGMYAEAKVTETFPYDFPVELKVFLGLVALFKQPHLHFVEGNHILMSEPDGSSEAIYNSSPPALSTKKKLPPAPAAKIDFLMTAAQHDMMRRKAKIKAGSTKFNMGLVSDGKRVAADYFVTSEDRATVLLYRCGWPLKGDPHGISCGVTLAKLNRWPLFKGGYRGMITEHYTTLTGLDVTYMIGHEPGLSWFGSQEPAKVSLEVV